MIKLFLYTYDVDCEDVKKQILDRYHDDIEFIVVVNDDIESILIKLIDNKETIKIRKIRKAPEMIVMRTTGDEKNYINSVLMLLLILFGSQVFSKKK